MTRQEVIAHLAQCKALADGQGDDLTPDEKAAFASQCAAKDAEAWQRIQGEPQLELAA